MASINQPAWRARTPLNLAAPLHGFPKHLEWVLPKFDLGKGISVDNHLIFFYLALNILNVEYEDVVCRSFPFIFKPKASSWYFSLQANSIANWYGFEKVFLRKFDNQKNVAIVVKELLSMRMEKKEKIQDFNQRFTTL